MVTRDVLSLDWQKLREEFRIIGALCGSLSKHPRQDIYYGLPMCLSPEEITLLKDKHIARLVWCPSLLERPNDQIRNNFAEEEITFHEAQVCLWKPCTNLLFD